MSYYGDQEIMRLTNQELASAIEIAHAKTRATHPSEDIYKPWLAHVQLLLSAQAARAK